ncbi:hypothetical protein [Cyclobacterium plantarum]|uniref:Uncharacterized protein n=1 Tax=Cyclobacterium plantarum TaxID=2716263 RepID=A0ABX0H1T6_9BACT|nr:hypothetical protein [Cyclobacterium plantarum]NHE55761.1 hypothetical protein [Cyclobacterium plantarum]
MNTIKSFVLAGVWLAGSFSCVSKSPIVDAQSNYKEGAVLLEPKWQRKSTAIWFIAPIIGAGLGGAYGYETDVFEGLENQEQNAMAYGGVGLLGGLLIAGAVSNRGPGKRPVSPKLNELDTWTKKYNQKNGTDYSLLRVEKDGRVLLTPEKLTQKLERFQLEYRNVHSSLVSNQPVDWDALDRYRRFLRDQSFEFFPEQRTELSRLITDREPEAAYATLRDKMDNIVIKPLELDNVYLLSYLKQNNRTLYARLSPVQESTLQETSNSYASRVFSAHFDSIRSTSLQSLDKSNLVSMQLIDDVYKQLSNQAGGFSQLTVVEEMFAQLRELKGEVVSENETKIKANFDRLNSISQLITARTQYLGNTDERPAVQRLNSLAQSMEAEILAEASRREAEQARLARERELAKFRALMDETTPTGEPTEAQMRFAIQRQVDFKNQKLENLGNAELDSNNPLTAMPAIMGTFLKGTKQYLEYFRKIACKEAASKGGFYCDYSVKRNVRGGMTGDMVNSMMRQFGTGMSTIENGRFVKVDGYWMLVEIVE